MPLLTNHLIGCLTGKAYVGDEEECTAGEQLGLEILDNTLYEHKVLRVNYTSYDMRRDQDSINPRNHADIMVLAHEDEDEEDSHPYWYARVIGVFHANIRYVGPGSTSREPQRIDFLWIRWFGRDMTAPGGFATRRYHRIGFLDAAQPGAFGFLDPAVVIRAVHLIPAFAYGRTSELLEGKSVARRYTTEAEDADDCATTDWLYYYVNM